MAANVVGDLIASHRNKRLLRLGDLARMLGADTPKRTSGLARRILRIEREGIIVERVLIARLGDVLGIDREHLRRAFEQQKAEGLRGWIRWLNEPVPVVLNVRVLPGVWFREGLGFVGEEEAVARASEYARHYKLQVALALNRIVTLWFDANGTQIGRIERLPPSSNAPMTRLKRR